MPKLTEATLDDWLSKHPLAILFFKSLNCGICQLQLPRIKAIAEKQSIPLQVIDLAENRHLAGTQMVLSVPVTKVFYQGKEVYKEGAYLDLAGLEEIIERYQQPW